MFRKLSWCLIFMLTAAKGFSQCAVTQILTPDPLPTSGNYLTGTTVSFCYSLKGWIEYGSNYVHGFLINLGPGWDTSTFKVTSLPGSCDGKGVWKFFRTDTSRGNPPPNNVYGWGVYYDKGIGQFGPNGIPGDNYGDHTVTGTCVWNLCFSIQVKTICDGADLSVSITATGDGTTGGWGSNGCKGVPFDGPVSTCKPNCNMALTVMPTMTDCAVNNGAATTNLTGGTPPYKYSWSNGSVVKNISGLGAGTYTVTVTDENKCTTSKSAIVQVNNPVSITTTATDISCFGFCDGTATVTPQGGQAPYTYTWSPAGSSQKITGLCAGSYSVSVSDANKCTRSGSATVNQFVSVVAAPSSEPVSCFGGNDGSAAVSVSSGTPPYTYKWINGQSSPAISNLNAGIYNVTVTDSRGCSLDITVTVKEPIEININPAVKNVSCFGLSDASIILNPSSGVAPYSYYWSSGETQNSISNIPTGLYSVTVTDMNLCDKKSSYFITQPPELRANFRQQPASCPEVDNGTAEVIAFGGVAPYTYLWKTTPVQTTAKVINLSYGSYKVQITDLNGCKIELTDSIKALPLFKVNAGNNKEIKRYENTNLSVYVNQPGDYSILWQPVKGLDDADIANPTASPSVTTTYIVTVINTDNGCKASDSVIVVVLPTDFLYVPNAFTPNADGQNDLFFPIAGDLIEVTDFKIYNRWGQLIFDDVTKGWDGTYKGTEVLAGSYAYYVIYKNINSPEEFRKQGSVTLLR